MKYDDEIAITKAREYKVVKANDLIQKSRYELSVVEQKTIAYIISKIKPNDKELSIYEFDILDYCKICGIDYSNGANYAYIKNTIKGLHDKSFWITLEDGTETLCSWINKTWISKKSGKVKIRLDDDLQKYLMDLSVRFTQYELLGTLPMKSQYSFRIYELLKSYEFTKKHVFDLEELKHMLMADNYDRYPDFRRKVIEIAIKEINEFTDLKVSYEPIKKGKKVIQLLFRIKTKPVIERWYAGIRATNTLNK